MYNNLKNSTILITGGTGSFGRKCIEIILKNAKPRKLIIFSRDELKQFEMSQIFNSDLFNCKISYYLGDVRDRQRLHRAFHGVDFVIHAAALKQVPAAEYNPCEAVKTNVMGAVNKAVNPVNLYGATKLCSEKLFVAGNSYVGEARTSFSVVRYGNVVGSRGSVIPLFLEMKKTGTLPVTDEKMTRFWMTLEQGVHFVLSSLKEMSGGEVFVPKIPSMKIVDLARAIAPGCKLKKIGIRPGEKLHESLITEDESRNTLKFKNYFVIMPERPWWNSKKWNKGQKLSDRFRYSSDTNDQWVLQKEIHNMIKDFIK